LPQPQAGHDEVIGCRFVEILVAKRRRIERVEQLAKLLQ
jgi:hypothetical protein